MTDLQFLLQTARLATRGSQSPTSQQALMAFCFNSMSYAGVAAWQGQRGLGFTQHRLHGGCTSLLFSIKRRTTATAAGPRKVAVCKVWRVRRVGGGMKE